MGPLSTWLVHRLVSYLLPRFRDFSRTVSHPEGRVAHLVLDVLVCVHEGPGVLVRLQCGVCGEELPRRCAAARHEEGEALPKEPVSGVILQYGVSEGRGHGRGRGRRG